jgi:ribosomal protein L11 methyltransferase
VIRLAVRVGRDDAGVVLAELLELSPSGVEERETEDGVEYVIYGAPGELPAMEDVEAAAAGGPLVSVTTEEIPDDWAERWKAWHRPVDVSWRFKRMRVRPPWEAALEDPDVIELVIDPGQAFGTGAHHTTRLCLELLLGLDHHGGPFADWGCGTAVLAIAAARLGFEPVIAVDNDPAALQATKENAEANGVALQVGHANLRAEPGPYAPVVAANLVRPLLLDVARLMTDPPEHLIASGLLREEADEVAAAFARHGLTERDRRHSGEWSALLLSRA